MIEEPKDRTPKSGVVPDSSRRFSLPKLRLRKVQKKSGAVEKAFKQAGKDIWKQTKKSGKKWLKEQGF